MTIYERIETSKKKHGLMENQDQTELSIVLQRAKYVLVCCVAMASIIVSILIFK